MRFWFDLKMAVAIVYSIGEDSLVSSAKLLIIYWVDNFSGPLFRPYPFWLNLELRFISIWWRKGNESSELNTLKSLQNMAQSDNILLIKSEICVNDRYLCYLQYLLQFSSFIFHFLFSTLHFSYFGQDSLMVRGLLGKLSDIFQPQARGQT